MTKSGAKIYFITNRKNRQAVQNLHTTNLQLKKIIEKNKYFDCEPRQRVEYKNGMYTTHGATLKPKDTLTQKRRFAYVRHSTEMNSTEIRLSL